MSDLRRSDSYYRKHCLSEQGIVPVQSEIKTRLGSNLTEAFFESCLPALKPYLGLTPTLDGPGDDLWVSPSDLLIGKVILKPPLTSKHIKALTHVGILEIGYIEEQKFIKERELDKQKAIAENEEILRFIAEKEKLEAMAQVREQERIKQQALIEQLKLNFEESLRVELQKLQELLEAEKEEAVEAGKKEVERVMQMKMELAVLETVQRLTEQFAEELMKQSKCLHQHFWFHIKQEKEKLKKLIMDEKSQCKDNLDKLRTEMQCENIANVMYVLAKERRRCTCERQIMEQNFLTRLQELEKELQDRSEKLRRTVSELERLGLEIQAREEAMFEIIKQFQKFIYFVLRAVPTQAEYLLNVEKIMIFELTKTVMDSKPKFFRKVDSSASESSATYEEDGENGLVVKDFHECENYVKYIPSASTLTSEEDMPAFTYNENLYVREDFRNMISQGLKISRSNHLWNFAIHDVVELIQPIPSFTDSPTNHRRGSNSDKDRRSVVSVRFSKGDTMEEQILKAHSFDTVPARSSLSSSSSSREYDDTGVSLSLGSRKKRSKLELARDSLVILKEKKDRSLSDTKKREVIRRSVKADSFLLSAKKSAESKISGTRQVLQRHRESKLSLAVDSLELLKTKDSVRSSHSYHHPVCTHSKRTSFVTKRKYTNIGIQVEPSPKAVTVSHIEVIPDSEENIKLSVVNFSSAKPNIIPTDDESETAIPMKPNLPRKWEPPEDIYSHASSCEVIGDKDSTAHLEKQDEFTAKRVTSFIRIFREQPSLRRMFTEVINK